MNLIDRLILPAQLTSVEDEAISAGTTCWLGLSGGLDSSVLLHLLKQSPLSCELKAVHVNHQISPNALAWEAFCVEVCRDYQIPLVCERVAVVNLGQGIEDAARNARYAVFERCMKPGDFFLTAHHADDQAETFFLRLLRGAGVKGLSAMSEVRPFANGHLWRPLLKMSRADLLAYAEQQSLKWINDESNLDDHYHRNFLRTHIFPALGERWPQYRLKVQQAADLMRVSDILLRDLADLDWQAADEREERLGKSISLTYLKNISLERRQNLLRFWLEKNAFALPELNHLQQIEQQLLNGRQDAEAQVNFGEVSLRVFREKLFALPLKALPKVEDLSKDANEIIPLVLANNKNTRLALPGAGYLLMKWSDKNLIVESLHTQLQNTQPQNKQPQNTQSQNLRLSANLPKLTLRFRQGGERAQPEGRAHSQTLKKLFQDYQVEPWLRDLWPLIYSEETLVAVPGLWVNHGHSAQESEAGVSFQLHFAVV